MNNRILSATLFVALFSTVGMNAMSKDILAIGYFPRIKAAIRKAAKRAGELYRYIDSTVDEAYYATKSKVGEYAPRALEATVAAVKPTVTACATKVGDIVAPVTNQIGGIVAPAATQISDIITPVVAGIKESVIKPTVVFVKNNPKKSKIAAVTVLGTYAWRKWKKAEKIRAEMGPEAPETRWADLKAGIATIAAINFIPAILTA